MSAFHLWGPSTVSPTAQVLQAPAHCHPGRLQSPFPIIRSLAGPCPTHLFSLPSGTKHMGGDRPGPFQASVAAHKEQGSVSL